MPRGNPAPRRNAAALADVPFYDYLWQFYTQNRRKVRSVYTQLTRKYLDYNDPDKGTGAFLRKPQFEALEMYVFLKEYCDNARLSDIFKDWQNRTGPFDGRGAFRLKIDELGLFERLDAEKFEAAFSRMKASSAEYPNYIYALTMGLGKTILMATCIFYEFLLAKKFPKEARYCHNALVFAPDKTVLQSLKEIQTFDKSKVVPPGYVEWLDANLKFQFLDDTSLSLQIIENSEYNIIISNNQKIILKRAHAQKTAVDSLFAAEKRYTPVASSGERIFEGLADNMDGIETEDDLIANQRFEMLKRLTNLGIYVDEAHHAFGNSLKRDLTGDQEKSLRRTINELAACLKRAGTHVVACFNYTGTPYVDNVLLPEVVYTYSLKDAIDHRYLKQADVKGYTNAQTKEFIKIVVKNFWSKYGERRVEGMLPKLAIFSAKIDELTGKTRPAVEEALAELNVSADRILVNVGDSTLTTNDDLREFHRLDTSQSEKQFILLVGKGTEGWNCRSLFAVALHRNPHSRNFVLQTTMRCLRAIGSGQETGTVYLSEENRGILSEELQNNFRLNVDELTGAGDKGKVKVTVKMVPPPVTVKLKRIRKHYELKELNLDSAVDFKLREVDVQKYAVIETSGDIKRIGKDVGTQQVLQGVKENLPYTALTLTAEVARYLGKGCIAVRRTLESSKDGMDAIVSSVSQYNEILYDVVIPKLFRHFYDLDETTTTEDIELRLVKPPKPTKGGGGGGGGGGETDVVAPEFWVKPELLATRTNEVFAQYAEKSFHLDNYCFDSNPEMDFFKTVLKDADVEHLYFTGMLTSDKTEFAVSYIDPESNTLRSYYPDFLALKKDGSYVIIEVKGENKIDDAVVRAKARSAAQVAVASGMTYQMIPSKKASFGLHQPQLLAATQSEVVAASAVITHEILTEIADELKYTAWLPVYSMRAACGKFGANEDVVREGWMEVPASVFRGARNEKLYVVRAVGHSMEPDIQDGQYVVIEYRDGTFDNNDIVLAQHNPVTDGETGGAYSIKKIVRTERPSEDAESTETESLTLQPLNPSYDPIPLPNEGEFDKDYKIVGVLRAKLPIESRMR